jgi:hypothetical protein
VSPNLDLIVPVARRLRVGGVIGDKEPACAYWNILDHAFESFVPVSGGVTISSRYDLIIACLS